MKRYKIPSIGGEEIEFKLLPAEEADALYQAVKLEDNVYLERYIFDNITDGKYADADLPAGVIPTTVFTCLKLSGVIKNEKHFLDLIEKSREKANKNSFLSMYARICSIQTSYTLDALRNKSLDELMELLAFCELLVGKPLIDTKKAREVLEKKEENSKAVGSKKGIAGLTVKDIDAIKKAIATDDFDMI